MKPVKIHKIFFLFLIVLGACGPKAEFKSARKLEKKGNYYKAWNAYQKFALNFPTHALAPEALFRAGVLTQKKMNDCYMAGTFYDNVLQKYPQSDPWARAALLQKDNCPDFFPLLVGSKWTEGDSETKGKNARIEIECGSYGLNKKILPSEAAKLTKSYFAGDKKFQTTDFFYKKQQSALMELPSASDPEFKTILKMPATQGASWATKYLQKIYRYEIVATEVGVTVMAGEFKGCIKVQSHVDGEGGIKNEYYAPGVGRILTTVATKNEEKRNTELLSYKLADWPDVEMSGTNP